MKLVVIWALWVTAGGHVNGGGEHGLRQPYIAAYFQSQGECERVQKIVHTQARWSQCIEAAYAQAPAHK